MFGLKKEGTGYIKWHSNKKAGIVPAFLLEYDNSLQAASDYVLPVIFQNLLLI